MDFSISCLLYLSKGKTSYYLVTRAQIVACISEVVRETGPAHLFHLSGSQCDLQTNNRFSVVFWRLSAVFWRLNATFWARSKVMQMLASQNYSETLGIDTQ
jgi:hypothetical protein